MIVTDDWSSGSLATNFVTTDGTTSFPAPTQIRTINGQKAFACSYSSGGIMEAYAFRTVGSDGASLQNMCFRARVCAWAQDYPPGPWLLPLFLCDQFHGYGTSTSTNFYAYLFIGDDGSLTFRIQTSVAVFTGGAGSVPMDGTECAIQLSLSFPSFSTVNFAAVVDNVSVLAGSYTSTIHPCIFPDKFGWGYFEFAHFSDCDYYHEYAGVNHVAVIANRYPTSCGNAPSIHTAITYYEIDNSSAIADFMPTGRVIVGTDCFKPSTITALSYNCDTNVFTITGTNFATGASVTLRGPENAVFTLSATTVTDTQIQGTLDQTFVAGPYCATVTNPCT